MKLFVTIPFIRILIPFIGGILFGILTTNFFLNPIILIPLLILILCLGFVRVNNKNLKIFLLLLIDVFFFLFGDYNVKYTNISRNEIFYGKLVNTDSLLNFTAIIDDLPIEKEKTIKCNLKLSHIKTENGYKKADGNFIAYFKKSNKSKNLEASNTLLLKAKLTTVLLPLNPNEYDYKAYLYNKQIYHTVFVDSNSFEILDLPSSLNTMWKIGLSCKSFILFHLKNSSLTENAYSICAALLTGYDDDIDKTVLEAFSHSGTLHVLSVSGLHIGLIYLVLSFLFDLLDRKKRFKFSKFIFITIFLWFFALITGFSAPVLRAVIMFNLLGIGKIFFRNNIRNQLNILLVSAFIILCYNPFFITDVGFLLSYFALVGLICIQPTITKIWNPNNRFINYLWQSITASFAATISTLPITLFYFKQFPIWFFLSNIVVVPATFAILLLAVFVVFKINFFAYLINYLILFLINFINLFNVKGFGFIDNIHFIFIDVFFLTILIILLSIAIYNRSYNYLMSCMLILIFWQLNSILLSYNSKNSSFFTVYHLKNTSVFALKNKNEITFNSIDSLNFNYHIKPHLNSFNHPNIKLQNYNYIKIKNKRILILNKKGYLPDFQIKDVTHLLIANNYNLTEKDLLGLKSLDKIIIDGSNNNFTLKKIEKLSCKFAFKIYNTKIKGAFLLDLNEVTNRR